MVLSSQCLFDMAIQGRECWLHVDDSLALVDIESMTFSVKNRQLTHPLKAQSLYSQQSRQSRLHHGKHMVMTGQPDQSRRCKEQANTDKRKSTGFIGRKRWMGGIGDIDKMLFLRTMAKIGGYGQTRYLAYFFSRKLLRVQLGMSQAVRTVFFEGESLQMGRPNPECRHHSHTAGA